MKSFFLPLLCLASFKFYFSIASDPTNFVVSDEHEYKWHENKSKMLPPPKREDPKDENEYHGKNFTSDRHGAELDFNRGGGIIHFKWKSSQVMVKLNKIRELAKDKTTGVYFPISPPPTRQHDNEGNHNFKDFGSQNFNVMSIDNVTLGNVTFEHVVVSTRLKNNANISFHMFSAMNEVISIYSSELKISFSILT